MAIQISNDSDDKQPTKAELSVKYKSSQRVLLASLAGFLTLVVLRVSHIFSLEIVEVACFISAILAALQVSSLKKRLKSFN